MTTYMKRPCTHCPFRRDVTPFLHPIRAEQIAYSAQSRYSHFACHKTTAPIDDNSGDMMETEDSKTCAGWFAMSINDGPREAPNGYEWPDGVYTEAHEMVNAYEEEWKRRAR